MGYRRRSRRTERGAAAVEFALVLPLLLVIVCGIINFGVVLSQNIALNNGAREAARYGAVKGPTCAQVKARAKSASSSIDLQPSDVPDANIVISGVPGCPTSPCKGSTPTQSIRVVITYESPLLVPMPIPGFPQKIGLEGVGEFRCEFS